MTHFSERIPVVRGQVTVYWAVVTFCTCKISRSCVVVTTGVCSINKWWQRLRGTPHVSTYMVPGNSGRLARVTVWLDELSRCTGSCTRNAVAEACPDTHIVVHLDGVTSWEGYNLLDRGGVAPRVLVWVQHNVMDLWQNILVVGTYVQKTDPTFITSISLK